MRDRVARLGAPLSAALVDVDLFKRYNDHYGHHRGDDCLRRVAAMKTRLRRPADMVARYGGQAFGLLLPDTDAAGALHLTSQVRDRLRQAQIEHTASSVAPLLTISISLSTWARHGSPTRIIRATVVNHRSTNRTRCAKPVTLSPCLLGF